MKTAIISKSSKSTKSTSHHPNPNRVEGGRKAARTRKARSYARAREAAIASAPNWGWKMELDKNGVVKLSK